MFFPKLIKSIRPSDRVLEIGPGGTPHPRSDVFLEYDFESAVVAESQRGYQKNLKTQKPVIYYKEDIFPFKDKEFDYIICSHVAEHVENLDQFVKEITRVGKAGYIEYPTIYYDYMYNIEEHLTFIKYKNSTLHWMSKNKTHLAEFNAVQALLHESLNQKHYALVNALQSYFFEGFEWFDHIKTAQTTRLEDLVFDTFEIPLYKTPFSERVINKVKRLLSI